MKPLFQVLKGHSPDDEDDLTLWPDGTVSASCYSYNISSWGTIELSVDETRQLYQALKAYFK